MEADGTSEHQPARPPSGATKTGGVAMRRTASSFLVASLFAMGGVGAAAGAASAGPASDPDPFEPAAVTVELVGPIDVTPDFVLPEAPLEEEPAGEVHVPDVTTPELVGPIDVTPDFVLPEGDAADPADGADVPAEGTYDDGEGDVPAEGTYDDIESQVAEEGTAQPVSQRTPRHHGGSLAFTGSNSALVLIGAVVLIAGALIAGLSALARRAGAKGGA